MLQVAPVDVQPVAVLHATSWQVEFDTHDDPGQLASQRQEPPHWTPLLHAPLSHVTEHTPAPHRTPVGQAFGPQWTRHEDDVVQSTPSPHAPAPQPTLHGAEPQRIVFEQALESHVTEQLDEARQSMTLLHALLLHCTVHEPDPHVIGVGQAPEPVHVMSQLDASVQSTLPLHEFAPQETRHGIPGGHFTSVGQLPDAEQSRTQTAPLHVPPAHAARQAEMAASEGAPSADGAASTGGTGVPPTPDSGSGLPPVPPELASTVEPPAPPLDWPPLDAPPLVEPPEPVAPSIGAAPPEPSVAASRPLPPPFAVSGGDTSAIRSYPMRPHAVNTTSVMKKRRIIATVPEKRAPPSIRRRLAHASSKRRDEPLGIPIIAIQAHSAYKPAKGA